jgi:hypothetical protein
LRIKFRRLVKYNVFGGARLGSLLAFYPIQPAIHALRKKDDLQNRIRIEFCIEKNKPIRYNSDKTYEPAKRIFIDSKHNTREAERRRKPFEVLSRHNEMLVKNKGIIFWLYYTDFFGKILTNFTNGSCFLLENISKN